MDLLIKDKFPYFKSGNYIYFDNAATTQVPGTVIHAVAHALAYKGNPYRGSHKLATSNQKKLEIARQKVAEFIKAKSEKIIFTNNTTDSINLAVLAIAGQIQNNDEILVAKTEHNSNLLPYLQLKNNGAKIKHFELTDHVIDLNNLKQKLTDRTKIVALQHCSNVTGIIQPLQEIIKSIKDYNPNIIVIVDGAQAVAHLPINVDELNCDFYAFSGHKMYGPDGIGVLYVKKSLHDKLLPVRAGGGSVSNIIFSSGFEQDYISPEYKTGLAKLEGGTPNLANAIGLQKAVGMFKKIGWDEIINHEQKLKKQLLDQLEKLPEVKLIKSHSQAQTIGLVSFSLSDPELNQPLAKYFNKHKIAIRYGSHCAFGLSDILGTETIRVSFGVYNTEEEVDQFINILKKFLGEVKGNELKNNSRANELKNIPFKQREILVKNFFDIQAYVKQCSVEPGTNITIMAGHFLAIPDFAQNTFHPSIKSLLPEHLHAHLEEFGMTEFPLYTWQLGNALLDELKQKNKSAKLMIVANDTTGINELMESQDNRVGKTVQEYRQEVLQKFYGKQGLPEIYLKILSEHKNNLGEIINDRDNLCYRESTLRDRFQKFIRNNKEYFNGLINYTANSTGELDIEMNILNQSEIKTCTFNTFHSKTGGKFCIAELVQLLGELFGKSNQVEYNYLSNRISNPKTNSQRNVFVIFSPAMCNNAVNRAAELYIKIFLRKHSDKEFHFINIPLGPNSEQELKQGIKITHISNR